MEHGIWLSLGNAGSRRIVAADAGHTGAKEGIAVDFEKAREQQGGVLHFPVIAGLDGSFVTAALVAGLILLAIHLPLLVSAVFGHWALGKWKRRWHLFYALPFTWYFLGLIIWGVSME